MLAVGFPRSKHFLCVKRTNYRICAKLHFVYKYAFRPMRIYQRLRIFRIVKLRQLFEQVLQILKRVQTVLLLRFNQAADHRACLCIAQFLSPMITNGLIDILLRLLSISIRPCLRKTVSFSHWFKLRVIASRQACSWAALSLTADAASPTSLLLKFPHIKLKKQHTKQFGSMITLRHGNDSGVHIFGTVPSDE